MSATQAAMPPPAPGTLLRTVRQTLRPGHYSPRTEEAYTSWIRRFILFQGTRHPADMGEAEISAFLTHLACERHVAAKTQEQALCALVFLYTRVLKREVGTLAGLVRARVPHRLPVVLSQREVAAVISAMRGTPRLMASLLYGSGLRLLECCTLRVKDIDLDRREITVRDGKGRKDRVTMLSDSLAEPLHAHLARRRELHRQDLADE